MRVKCQSVDAFIKNLEGEKVYEKTIYIDSIRNPLDEASHSNHVIFEVILQASAIVWTGDDGQSLIQYGQHCGVDRDTADRSVEGTECCSQRIKLIEDFCSRSGLVVKPGILDY